MTKTIQQSVRLKASAKELFDAFLDSGKHSAFTGMPAKTSRKVGGRFTAFGGMLSGRNLLIVPGRLIVQAWRSQMFKPNDPDSILILCFENRPGGGQIDLVHANVPRHDHASVTKGWPKYYWRPWKKHLATRTKRAKRR